MKICQLLIFIVLILSCEKNKINTDLNTTMVTNTTKNYSYEPIYRLKIRSSLSYNIKINGITTATKNQNAGDTRWFLINNCIPASGEQNIEITLLPRMSNKGTEHLETIDEKDEFTLEVEKTSWKDGGLVEPSIVYTFILNEGAAVNKTVYLHKGTFKADIPYQLVDWRDGKDLSKIDSLKLKEQLLKSYEKIKSSFENQQGQHFVKLVEKGMFNLAQGAYLKTVEFENLKEDKQSFINKQKRELENFSFYKMDLSGDGKLVSFRRGDGYNSGEGVLRRKYKKNGQETVHIDDIVFYIPKNSDSLEVVVYQNLVKPYFP